MGRGKKCKGTEVGTGWELEERNDTLASKSL